MTAATAEGHHAPPPGAAAGWQEAWEFEAWWDEGTSGLVVHVSRLPLQRRAWYWMGLVRAGEPLVTLADLAVPLPRSTLELRTAGLWAEHVCEEPMDHWTVANEAHAVALDDPELVHTRPFGDVVAVALDLGFEDRPEDAVAPGPGLDGLEGYQRACDVYGEVLLEDGRIALDGVEGRRRHWWGDRRWGARRWGAVAAGRRAPVALEGEAWRSRLELVLGPDGWSEANTPVP